MQLSPNPPEGGFGYSIHGGARKEMIEKKESRVKNCLALLLIAAIAFVGVVSHAMIASGYVDAKLAQMGRSIGIEPVEYPELPE